MKKSFLFFVLIVLCYSVSAQTPFFQQYFLMKKNEPVHVNRIFQDKNNFIWFGTNKGLFRFNGKNYERFTTADALPDNDVTAIAQDSLGRIWTGHKSGKISFLENGRAQVFETPEGSASQAVSDILFGRNGVLWFSTLNDGLYYYRRNRLYRLDEKEGMPDLFIYDILEDGAGRIWAGTDGGVAICSLGSDQVTIHPLDNDDGLPDNIVKKLALAGNKNILLATEDAGIFNYDTDTKKFESVTKGKWPHGSVSDFILKENKIWISTQSGLLIYDLDQQQSKQYSGHGSIPANATLLNDREGNIWAGSRAGVIRTPGDHFEFIESLGPAKDVNVIAVAGDVTGNLWFSTNEGLFRRGTDEAGNITIQEFLSNTPYRKFHVISLYIDEAGFVWAGLYGEGVLRIHPVSGDVKLISRELKNGNILHITGKGNVVWLATLGGSERITISGDKLLIENFSRENGLSSDFIYQVFIDSKDRVWFATDGKGVDMRDDAGFNHFENGLPSKVVYGFAEDKHGVIWVNVQGNGIYKFEAEKFLPIEVKLRDINVQCLSADDAGNLIIVNDLGIDIYNVEKERIRYFGEEVGIKSRKASLNALATDKRGRIFIGTDGGIIQYTSNKSVTQKEPHISIDVVKVFDQKVELNEKKALRYDENSLTVNFYGLWYQNPEALNFQYKMDNYDQDWIATGDNDVTYSRLPAGDYTFRVKVSDNNDFASAREASIKFHINPPFWRTPAFYMLCAGMLVAAGYSFIRYREKQLVNDKLMLAAKVEERTLEIQRKKEEIQAQNEEIMAQAEEIKGINENLEMLVHQRTAELEKKNKALEEYAFITAHKLRSPLASILGLINLIAKTKLDDDAREINRHLQNSADELDDVIRSITKAIERGDK